MNNLLFRLYYLFKPPWDTGIPVPELQRALVDRPPGKALDLGCGTGTNVRYLVEHGWQATGIDFVPRAITKARRKLGSLPATLLVADVTKLAELDLPGPFDLALDVGCFHSLPPQGQQAYIRGLCRWLKPGALYLVYAWQPGGEDDRRGLPREQLVAAFEQAGFKSAGYEQGRGRPSAWYYFERGMDQASSAF